MPRQNTVNTRTSWLIWMALPLKSLSVHVAPFPDPSGLVVYLKPVPGTCVSAAHHRLTLQSLLMP
eukprot:scaffold112140_cov22-Tisochrysis_lutea.AAC.1